MIESLIELLADILNTYNASYADRVTSVTPNNIHDVEIILSILIKEKNSRKAMVQSSTKQI